MPPAYVICDIDVSDPAGYDRYKQLSAPSVERHGGRYLVRGGDPQPLEGDWQPGRVVVLEFDDAAAARAWYESDDYTAARELRQGAATASFLLVQGGAPPG